MHHPLEWLKDQRDAHLYLSSRARVLIFGHEHFQQITRIENANHEDSLVISSGAVTPEHATAPYIYRYNVLQFSLDQSEGEPCLAVTVFPRVWVLERTRFDADSARLGGRESTTFMLRCPQFKLPVNRTPSEVSISTDSTNGDPDMDARDSEPFARLSYLFWRYLGWQERLKVLVQADVLPKAPQAPLPQTVEHLALDRARKEGKLGQLWKLTMQFVPEAQREPNPFTERKD